MQVFYRCWGQSSLLSPSLLTPLLWHCIDHWIASWWLIVIPHLRLTLSFSPSDVIWLAVTPFFAIHISMLIPPFLSPLHLPSPLASFLIRHWLSSLMSSDFRHLLPVTMPETSSSPSPTIGSVTVLITHQRDLSLTSRRYHLPTMVHLTFTWEYTALRESPSRPPGNHPKQFEWHLTIIPHPKFSLLW